MSFSFFRSSLALIVSAFSMTALTYLDSEKKALAGNNCPKAAIVAESAEVEKATPVSKENYAFAETDIILAEYVKKIAQNNCSEGIGEFMHIRDAININDRTIIRPNFDTLYSAAVIDLNRPAVIVMPETDRLQILAALDEEHWNVLLADKPGRYEFTKEAVGARYIFLIVRTQVNMNDPDDLQKVSALQDRIQIKQTDKGEYLQTKRWERREILALRDEYNERWGSEGIKSELAFGRKGEISPEMRNFGVAFGWGGLPKKGAVYPSLQVPISTDPLTLTLKNVPIADNAFWSVTIYNQEGFSRGEHYNINSAFAKANENGEYVLNFGTSSGKDNYLEIYPGWNATLRIYSPQSAYFNGEWVVPSLRSIQKN